MHPPKTVGLIANLTKKSAASTARRLMERLGDAGIRVLPQSELAASLGVEKAASEEAWMDADLILCLGGDGTLLSVARAISPREGPLLGLNLGGLGFLTAVPCEEVDELADAVIAGRYVLENRHFLRVVLEYPEGSSAAIEGMNEIVIDEGTHSRRALALRVSVDGTQLGPFTADGLIVATPTGSTAYALSAGGPIIRPSVSAMVLTAICPHSLAVRPLVFGEDEEVVVESLLPDVAPKVTVDGQETLDVPHGTRIHIGRSPRSLQLAFLEGRPYYEILRSKLNWGGIPKDR